jgi:hypothetical protein
MRELTMKLQNLQRFLWVRCFPRIQEVQEDQQDLTR